MNETAKRIEAIRAEWGDRLLILGHHYQTSAVLMHADVRGDSLELARRAGECRDVERIVFCGVRFMAETADALTGPEQSVYMPDTTAGCPMADMADEQDLERAWRRLRRVGGDWVPIVYVNSSIRVKALCGRLGGCACTSGNAARVLAPELDAGRGILFAPDEHLGVNTLHDLGYPEESAAVYDPALPDGGLSDEDVARARLVAWKGYCHVHTAFTLDHVRHAREAHPGARVIVHPESPSAVVRAADAHGSTAEIIRYVEQAPDGAVIVIGTELQLVRRLAETHAARLRVFALTQSSCPNMAKTRPDALRQLLETWPDNLRVRVPPEIADDARLCLDRMLAR